MDVYNPIISKYPGIVIILDNLSTDLAQKSAIEKDVVRIKNVAREINFHGMLIQ